MAAKRKNNKSGKIQYARSKGSGRTGGTTSVLIKRLLIVLFLLVVFGGLVYGVFVGFNYIGELLFSKNPSFEIQHLIVTTDGRLSEDKIRGFAKVSEGDNLFSRNLDTMEKELKQVSDIESVYLERILPHTLIIKVKERVPLARIVGNQKSQFPKLVDRYGYILPYRHSAANLPIIKGLDREITPGEPVNHHDVDVALKILSLCESEDYLRKYVHISSLDLKYSDFIDMRLEDGARVRMPRFSIKKKLYKLAASLKLAADRGERFKEWDLTLDTPTVPARRY